jgi:hypothetical protein
MVFREEYTEIMHVKHYMKERVLQVSEKHFAGSGLEILIRLKRYY